MGWKTSGSSKQLIEANKCISSPKEIARLMNNFFLDKVETIRKSMPVSTLDLSKIQEIMLHKNCSLDIENVSLTKVKIFLTLSDPGHFFRGCSGEGGGRFGPPLRDTGTGKFCNFTQF